MKLLSFLLQCLLVVLTTTTPAFNPFPILETVANRLTSQVQNGQLHPFIRSFDRVRLSDAILNLAHGSLFDNESLRRSFKVIPHKTGAQYTGNLNNLKVYGKLTIILFDLSVNHLRTHTFDTTIKKINGDWIITALRPASTPYPLNSLGQRKRFKHNDDWMWSTGYGKK